MTTVEVRDVPRFHATKHLPFLNFHAPRYGDDSGYSKYFGTRFLKGVGYDARSVELLKGIQNSLVARSEYGL